MRKTAAHFKPKSTEKPKRKKVVAVTLATALVLALVIALAVAGCNDSGEAGSESSGPAATPTAAPTEEPAPSPSPSPSPTPAPTPSAQPEEEPDFVWNVPTEKAGVTAGFYTDGEEYFFEMSSDTANSATLLEWLSTGLFIGMDPMADRIDTIVQNSTSTYQENGISYAMMEGYGRKWTFYINQISDDTSTGGPGLIGVRVNKKEELEACYTGDIGESASEANSGGNGESNSHDEQVSSVVNPFQDQSKFISTYTMRMLTVSAMQEGYQVSVTEGSTEAGEPILYHTLNGGATNVTLSFVDNGILLNSNSSTEDDVATTMLCSAAVMFDSSKSVGSFVDAFSVIGEMIAEISESGSASPRTYDGVEYQLTSGESLQFTAIPAA